MESTTKLKDLEAARSLVYQRLADAYRQPSLPLGATLDALADALACLDSEAREEADRLRKSYAALADKCILEIEYTRLFLGPFVVPAPPYGSIYLEKSRRLMGDSTIDAKRHYLSVGLDLSPEFKDAPDHIAAELEFMQALIVQGIAAVEASDGQLLLENIRQQHTFLNQHLGAWIPLFTAKVSESASCDYYRHLAALTRIFIDEDMAALPNPADLQASSAV